MFCSCCSLSKGSKREERYYIKNDDCGKYSWDTGKRNLVEEYRFVSLIDEIAIKPDGSIAGQQFTVEKCKGCCILLLDHSAAVNVDECEECLIVIGPCEGSVFIRDCKDITLFTICQQFRSRDCINIDVFLFCATKPIIESSKLMRFRSLALSYDKLEEHMSKASLSPFINYWNSVYDFTPEDVSNFEICITEYTLIQKMDMIKAIKNIQFSPEQSTVPFYTFLIDATDKKLLVLCVQRNNEATDPFYDRILKFLRMILAEGAKLITTRDMVVRKKQLQSLFTSKKYSKLSGRLITLEIAWNREQMEKSERTMSDTVEVVKDDDFEYYRTVLYQFAQMQTDIC